MRSNLESLKLLPRIGVRAHPIDQRIGDRSDAGLAAQRSYSRACAPAVERHEQQRASRPAPGMRQLS